MTDNFKTIRQLCTRTFFFIRNRNNGNSVQWVERYFLYKSGTLLCKMTDVKLHEFKVAMTCEGCSGAVERVLGKLKGKGVDDFKVNLASQKVEVKSSLSADEILEVIKKTGKETQLISSA